MLAALPRLDARGRASTYILLLTFDDMELGCAGER